MKSGTLVHRRHSYKTVRQFACKFNQGVIAPLDRRPMGSTGD